MNIFLLRHSRAEIQRGLFFRTFLRELEQYTDCPELVGRCFLQRVRESSG